MYLWKCTGGTPHSTGLPPLAEWTQPHSHEATLWWQLNHWDQKYQIYETINITNQIYRWTYRFIMIYLLLAAGHIPVTVGLKNLKSWWATAVDRLTPATLWTSAQWHGRNVFANCTIQESMWWYDQLTLHKISIDFPAMGGSKQSKARSLSH